MAIATRSATELAKCSSSDDHARGVPVCSKQTTPAMCPRRRIGASSNDVTPCGSRYEVVNALVRGSRRASYAAIVRSLSSALKYTG